MKRDDDFIREILFQVEKTDANRRPVIHFPERDKDQLLEHLELLIDASLLEGQVARSSMRGPRVLKVQVERLTWEGQEFLETIRNEQVWGRIKKHLAEKGGGISFEVLKSLAIEVSKQVFLSAVN